MTTRIKRTEGGSGGKRGHSNMTHYDVTAWIKDQTRKLRRRNDKAVVREQEQERDA